MIDAPLQLCRGNLREISRRVPVPTYLDAADRGRSVIAHIGAGNFHTAHQCTYLDELLTRQPRAGWRVVGIDLLDAPRERAFATTMAQQDNLACVVTTDDAATRPRIIGSRDGHVHAPADPAAAVRVLAAPITHLVTMTVTESGYFRDPDTGEFSADAAELQADLRDDAIPRTWPAVLAAALRRRKDDGLRPFSVLSCDNLIDNGTRARQALLGFLERKDPELHAWTTDRGAFPGCMVDRITLQTTDEHRRWLREEHGIVDGRPAFCEPHREWHVQDWFCGPRPPLEDVGVHVTDDVARFELLKLRELNGGHQALAHIGLLRGYRQTHEAMADEHIRRYLQALLDDEIVPCVGRVAGASPDYVRTILHRFANSQLGDTLGRLAEDSWTRMHGFVFPSLLDQLRRPAADASYARLAFCVATWLRVLVEHRSVRDSLEEPMRATVEAAGGTFDDLLAIDDLLPAAVRQRPPLVATIREQYDRLRDPAAALGLLLDEHR